MELITGENDKGRRLDRVLRKALPDHPLPLLHRLLRQGRVFVDGKPAKAQDRLDAGIKINIPALKGTVKHTPAENIPLCYPLSIIWQGCGLIAVNKPTGIAVHGPADSSRRHSLEKMVQAHLAGKIPASLSFKPGPLHRLDKPSSGIVVFSTNIEGARLFSTLLRERKVQKTYLAIVKGDITQKETWENELARDTKKKKTFVSKPFSTGKTAITKITPLARTKAGTYSLIAAQIITGRTHQIRAQAASCGYPLAGDVKYGDMTAKTGGSFFLHAWKLEFLDFSITAPPPADFEEKVKTLFEADIFKFI